MQYAKTMEKTFTGDLFSYSDAASTSWTRSRKRAPRTFALAIGAAIIWMLAATAIGVYTAVQGGQVRRTAH